MPGAVIIPDADESPAADLAGQAAHDAAVAEGGAQVREEQAAEHASRSEAAAEVALAVAEENAAMAQQVIEATGTAEAAAEESRSLAEMMREEHEATRAMVAALAEEIRAGRAAQPPAEPVKASPERPPGQSRPKWTRRLAPVFRQSVLFDFACWVAFYVIFKALMHFVNIETRRNGWTTPAGVTGLLA